MQPKIWPRSQWLGVGLLFLLAGSGNALAAAPAVTTSPASSISSTSAVFNGLGNPNGEATTGWFRYSTSSPGACNDSFGIRVPASGGTSLGSGTSGVGFTETVTGLLPGTTYYYCAIASNATGLGYGNVLSFTTLVAAPTVTTTAATSLTGTSATLTGVGRANGAASTGWFRYSAIDPGACSDSFGTRAPSSGGSNLGSGTLNINYSQSVTGLSPGTTYYFCAIASNAAGTSYGAILTFTTPSAPSVTTSPASGVIATAATLNGSATPNGATATGYFRYSTANPGACTDSFGTRAPASGGSNLGSGSSAVNYSQSISGLLPGTTYYFCALANNMVGTSFGLVQSFTTPATAPIVTTAAATSVSGDAATLNGTANPRGAATTGYFRFDTVSPGTCNDTFGYRTPAAGGSALGAGNTAVAFSEAVTGLLAGVTYYYCAIAENSEGTSFGAVMSFTTPTPPTVVTGITNNIWSTTATINGSANPNYAATTGWFRYSAINPGMCNDTFGTRAPTTGGSSLGSGGTALAYSRNLSGLTAGTTYYYCAIAQNSEGTSFGTVLSFTTLAPPTVTTSAATAVASTSATLNGTANPNGTQSYGWFRYSATNPSSCNNYFGTRAPSTDINLGAGTSAVPYTTNVTGLLPGTTYYYCAIGWNNIGTQYGSIQSFTTAPLAPIVTTTSATGLTGTTAYLNGWANPQGAATTAHFRYDSTNPGTCNDSFGTRAPASGGASLGSGTSNVTFSEPISGLSPGATYYFCAIATNSEGTSYGAVVSFTMPSAPTVTTTAATPVGGTSATLNGTVNPNLGSTTAWFRYSTTNPVTCNDSFGTRLPTSGGNGMGAGALPLNHSLTAYGLTPGTTYYFCAIASNVAGTSFGGVLSFTTLDGPSVTTLAESSVTATSATLNGSANPNGLASTGWFRISTTNPVTCSDSFGTRLPTSGGSALGSGTSPVSYSQVASLAPATTYYFCAIAQNSVATRFGTVRSFTTPAAAPTVVTNVATAVTSSSATLNGWVNPNGAASTGWFRYSTTNPGTCDDTFGTRAPATGGVSLGAGTSGVAMSQPITGLTLGTVYYYCAIASNSEGTGYGAIRSFVTLPEAPTVTTSAATSVTSTTATLNGSANPNAAQSYGWFRYSATNPVVCNNSFGTQAPNPGQNLGTSTSAVPYSTSISGLLPGTTYYFCAIASNSVGMSFGTLLTFVTPPAAPIVTTQAASSVTGTTATLNGSATPRGAATQGYFRYSSVNPGSCDDTFGTRAPASGGTSLGSGNTAQPFSEAITGLTPATTYYFCAIAVNSEGTSFGTVQSFITPIPPIVTTSAASVSSNSASLSGWAIANNAPTSGWFRYSTTDPGSCNDTFGTRAPTTGGLPAGSGTTNVNFWYNITGLTPGTTYYYCAIASNSAGTSFGNVVSFTTSSAPTVSTELATGVTTTTATLNGIGNPNGVQSYGWFYYSLTNPGSCTSFGLKVPSTDINLGTGSADVPFSVNLTGLLPGATYYYCAAARNVLGTRYGALLSFTATPQAPTVDTVAAISITSSSATLRGYANPHGDATTTWFRYSDTNPGSCDDTFGTRTPATGGNDIGSGPYVVNYTLGVTGLSYATTYYFCTIAENSYGKRYGSLQSFTTGPLPPTVTTVGSASVTSSSATLNGSANPNGGSTTGYFRYGTVDPVTCTDSFGTRAPATGGTSLGSGKADASYSQSITGLLPGTTYYFCAAAVNPAGARFGAVLSFTTQPTAPIVTTTAASSVTSGGATLNGSANPRGASTTAWFRYSTTNPGACDDTFGTRAPASGGSSVGSGTAAVSYSQAVSGLAFATTYYYCAIAQNSVGLSYGGVLSFTTQPTAPSVTTLAASGVTQTAATLNGSATPNGAASTGWFRYGPTDPGSCNDTFGTRAPAIGGTALGAGMTSVSYSVTPTTLSPGVTYYFCAIAQSSAGLSFGSVLSFTTSGAPPTTTTTGVAGLTGTTAVLNGTSDPNGDATIGWFRYGTANPGTCNDTFGTRAPASGGTSVGSGTGAMSFGEPISGLTPGTTYYFCAISANSLGTTFGAVLPFTTPSMPTVTTTAASAITATSATLNGTANPNGSASTGYFRYGTTNPGTCDDTFGTRAPVSGGSLLGSGTSPLNYSRGITGLSPATTYYYCAAATSSGGTGFGLVLSFTTAPAAPVVTTAAASAIAGTSATLNGSANPNGSATTGYFRYGTTNPSVCSDSFGTRAPAIGGSALGSGNTAATFSQSITGLSPGTTYYYCAAAVSSLGTAFGAVMSFTTLALPAVTTVGATSVTSTEATLNGSANPRASATIGYFRFSATSGTCSDSFGTRVPATGGTALGSGSSSVPYTEALTGLLPATTYYFCAAATNSVGTTFGSVLTFRTPGAPIVTTNGISFLTSTSASLGGLANPNGASTTGYFRYGATNPGTCDDTFGTRAPATGGSAIGSGTTALSYVQPVTGLTPGTTYYFCAAATNAVGTSFGAVMSFTTTAVPTVTTTAATSVSSTGATLNGTANPNGAATSGYFRYGTTNPGTCTDTFGTRAPSSGGYSLGSGSTALPYSQAVFGLSPGMTYYYCAAAVNLVGTSFGAVMSFVTPTYPTVTTSPATGVTGTGATLNGSANPKGAATTGYFRYASYFPWTCDDSFGTRIPATGGTALGSGNSDVTYSEALTGLSPGTTYYFCAAATNSVGTRFGGILSFTTPAAPTVTTSAATAVTSTGATLNGSANPRLDSTTGYFRYGTTNPSTCDDTFGTRAPSTGGTSLGSGNSPAPYTETLTGLTPATTYYFCAAAVNSVGTTFGAVLWFRTPGMPVVTTLSATGVTSTGAQLNGTGNPNGASATGYFRYGTTNPGTCSDTFGTRAPATGGSALGAGTSTWPYSQTLSGLTPGTTYYFCAAAVSSVGTSFGSVLSFATPATPAVTTAAATAVTTSGATLNGSADPNGASTTGYFRLGTVDPGTCSDTFGTRVPLSGGSPLGSGSSAVAYSQTLTGLTPGTRYYFCAAAINSVGTSFGTVLSFTTPALPAVTTSAATAITTTGATLNGSANPGHASTTGYFRYGTTHPGTCSDTFGTRTPATGGAALGSGSSAVAYSQALTGLAPGTTYYFCAAAVSSVGTAFGGVLTFTTPAMPAVTTAAATAVTTTGATLNGSANPGYAATTGYFRYGTTNPGTCTDSFGTRAPVTGGASLGSGGSAVTYSQTVTGLTPATTYYFCAAATNSVGTSFGAVLSYSTPATPTVTTTAATAVTSTGATLNGSANPNSSATSGYFRYGTTNPGTCSDSFGTRAPATGGIPLGSSSAEVAYSQTLTGLTPGTTYYFCAAATNSVGTAFGAVLTFNTPAMPTVTTAAATAVTTTGATLNGSANPGFASATGYFRYGTTDPGTCSDGFGTRAPATGGASLGSGNAAVTYSQVLTGLTPGTTYYFCAAATNSVGTAFGAVLTFSTPALPTVTTAAATGLTSTGATLNGSANPGFDSTTGYFRYGTTNPGTCSSTFGTRAPAAGGTSLGSGGTPVTYSEVLTGLTPATTYYYCAAATNSLGTSFGAVLSFTTPATPTVTTSAATAVTGTGATLNGSANPNGSATSGYFRYGTTNPGTCSDTFGARAPSTGGTALGSGSSEVAYSQALTGLAPGTTYFFCAAASNSVGSDFGAVLSFSTPAAPTVTTSAATAVTSTGATLNGSANPGFASATGYFRYGPTDPGTCSDVFGTRAPASGGSALGSGGSDVAYSEPLTGLAPGTTYYFCAAAVNSVGTSFGAVLSFTTPAAPTVTTFAATGVTSTGATLNGSATPGFASATGYFRYGTVDPGACDDTFGTRAPASGGSALGSGSSAVTYSQGLSGLTPGTTYYFCAAATNSVGTSFGAVLSFTAPAAPTVTTAAATAVTSTGATLNGSANPGFDPTTGYFRYGTTNPGTCDDTFGTRAPASGGQALGSGSSEVAYSEALTGLTPGTTYYFCAAATNSVGTSFGAVLTFDTPGAPVVTTSAATAVGATAATLNGSADPRFASTEGYFRYDTNDPGACNDTFGTRAPASGGQPLGSGGSPAPYSEALTGLTPGTTYYFCAIATSSVGTSFGAVLSFSTAATAPSVTTLVASAVAGTTATLEGSASANGAEATGYFRHGTTDPGTCDDTFGTRAPASGGTTVAVGGGAVTYSEGLTGLTPGTTYFFCAAAANSEGTSFGAVLSFTTSTGPTVTTVAASGVIGTGATLNGSANPNHEATEGYFRYDTVNPGTCDDTFGTRAPASGGAALGAGGAEVSYSETLSGLVPGTTYYFCALATNATGTAFGMILTFTTPPAPLVTTVAASDVTASSATLNASANPNGDAATGWLRYDVTDPGTCNDTFGTRVPATGAVSLGAGTADVPFSEALTGLAPNATYYFCALAQNSAGLSMGAVLSFTTPAAPPAVTTTAPTNVGQTSATLNGAAIPNGAEATAWFRYDTVDPGTCDDSFGTRAPASAGFTLGAGATDVPFSQELTGLTLGSTYYFCAIASNAEGTSVGQVLSFTTGAPAPTVVTLAATDVGPRGASLNGAANPNGTSASGWFRYDTVDPGACNDTFGTRVPGQEALPLGQGTAEVTYAVALTGLEPATTYYFCAVAANQGGAAFGQVLAVTTSAEAPAVTTLPAVAELDGTVTLNGAADPKGSEATGWFRYDTAAPGACSDSFGTRLPEGGGVALGAGRGDAPFSEVVTLPEGTYYFCAIAQNAGGVALGEVLTVEVTDSSVRGPGCGCGTGASGTVPQLVLFATALIALAGRRRRARS